MKTCKNCGKEFQGNTQEFCSWQCSEAKTSELKKRLKKVIDKDKSHTEGFSKK